MIVVDSSVWIANLRGLETQAVRKLRALVENDDDQLVIGDLILLEILQGARGSAHAAQIERALRQFRIVTMLGDHLAVRAAHNFRHLRSLGVTIRKTVDLIVGTFCIEEGHSLLHDDRDFAPMANHLGLRLS